MRLKWPFALLSRHLLFSSLWYVFIIITGTTVLTNLRKGALYSHWIRSDSEQEGPGDRKIILLWNPFFGEPDYGIGGFGATPFYLSNCSRVCYTTNDKSYLERADAVVIHTYKMGPKWQNVTLPKRAHKNQIFVFFILESPVRSWEGFVQSEEKLTDVFNLTFTYLDHPETDIYIPMGGTKRRIVPAPNLTLTLFRIRKKVNYVAWFVSNCKASSHRMEYARELNKYVPVHIYGECGNYSCQQGDFKCYQAVMKEYMFYLSFENSFCQDYATEKVFRMGLKSHMVPIVYGMANYTKLLRPKSVIDVRDYKSPKDLAKYLMFLKQNPLKYKDYLEWKRDYEMLLEGDFKAKGFCKLCKILHTKDYQYKKNFNPMTYWNPERWCRVGKAEDRAVHLI